MGLRLLSWQGLRPAPNAPPGATVALLVIVRVCENARAWRNEGSDADAVDGWLIWIWRLEEKSTGVDRQRKLQGVTTMRFRAPANGRERQAEGLLHFDSGTVGLR